MYDLINESFIILLFVGVLFLTSRKHLHNFDMTPEKLLVIIYLSTGDLDSKKTAQLTRVKSISVQNWYWQVEKLLLLTISYLWILFFYFQILAHTVSTTRTCWTIIHCICEEKTSLHVVKSAFSNYSILKQNRNICLTCHILFKFQ